jgi:hypothetical protein
LKEDFFYPKKKLLANIDLHLPRFWQPSPKASGMADMEALRAELAASKAREAALEQRIESLEHASPINFINTLFAKQESPEATSAQR